MPRLLPVYIARNIRGDAEERIAAMAFVLVRSAGFVETVEGLLQQVVGQVAIARDARKLDPHGTRGSLIERTETFLVYQSRGLGFRARAANREQRIGHEHG